MYGNTFRLNGVDFSQFVHEEGVQITYKPIKGLADEYTEDNTRHVDLKGYKKMFSVRVNATTKEESRTIKNMYTSGLLFLTSDIDAGEDVTYLVEPAAVTFNPALVEGGIVSLYDLGTLTFDEL